jgi:L-asparagine transporter-like permease
MLKIQHGELDMTLIGFIVVMIIIGAALYIIKLLPIDETFKQIIKVILIVIFVIYAIYFLFGLATGSPTTINPFGR